MAHNPLLIRQGNAHPPHRVIPAQAGIHAEGPRACTPSATHPQCHSRESGNLCFTMQKTANGGSRVRGNDTVFQCKFRTTSPTAQPPSRPHGGELVAPCKGRSPIKPQSALSRLSFRSGRVETGGRREPERSVLFVREHRKHSLPPVAGRHHRKISCSDREPGIPDPSPAPAARIQPRQSPWPAHPPRSPAAALP